jgi:hypothetical protein
MGGYISLCKQTDIRKQTMCPRSNLIEKQALRCMVNITT